MSAQTAISPDVIAGALAGVADARARAPQQALDPAQPLPWSNAYKKGYKLHTELVGALNTIALGSPMAPPDLTGLLASARAGDHADDHLTGATQRGAAAPGAQQP